MSVTQVPVRVGGWRRALRATHGRAYPRLIGNTREKSWLFYETLLPLLGTLAFAYVYRSLGAPERYIGYVVMAGAMSALWLNVMWMMASQLWWEKQDGNLELYMIAPCGLVPILLGMSVGGFLAALLRGIAVVIIGSIVFDVSYVIHDLPVFVLVFGVSVVALYGLGTVLASLFLLWGREAWHTMNMFMEPVFLLSGFYFPVRTLGFGIAAVASLIPLTLAMDAMRQLLYPDAHPALLPVGVELAILVGLAAALVVAARALLGAMTTLARREGRLSDRS